MNTTQLIPSIINSAYATGVLTSDETNIADGATVVVGSITYRFKNTMAQAYDVKRHTSSADTSLANLVAAINGTGTAGTEYYAGTVAHPLVRAGTVTSHASTLTAINIGYGANTITSTGATHLTFAATTLTGGVGGALSLATINGDANGDTVYSDPIDMAYYDEAIAFLNVTAHAGTSPTLDVSFEFSPDGYTWMASGDAFSQVTETNSLTLKRFTANFGKHVRAKVVTGGTNPAYTLSLYIIGKGE